MAANFAANPVHNGTILKALFTIARPSALAHVDDGHSCRRSRSVPTPRHRRRSRRVCAGHRDDPRHLAAFS